MWGVAVDHRAGKRLKNYEKKRISKPPTNRRRDKGN